MNNFIFGYDQEAALRAGQAGVQTGAEIFNIESAEYRNHNGYESLNLALVTEGGAKTFADLTYKDASGKAWTGNVNHINAIIGLLGLQGISSVQQGDKWFAPELTNKKIGLVLQKRFFTKGDGSDGNGMNLVMAFDMQTRQTLKEKINGTQAIAVDKILETLEDKDDRKKGQAQQQYSNQSAQGNQQFTGGF